MSARGGLPASQPTIRHRATAAAALIRLYAVVRGAPAAAGALSTARAQWLARPGHRSLAMARIGWVVSWWLVLPGPPTSTPETYDPEGILQIFFPHPPSQLFLDNLFAGFPWLMLPVLLGVMSRVTVPLMAFTGLFVASFPESYVDAWSHSRNVLCMLGMVLAFAPHGRAWSVDSYVRRRLGRKNPAADSRLAFAWVLLAEMMVALPFFFAGIHKLRGGDGRSFIEALAADGPLGMWTLDWITSDSFRNILVWDHWALNRPVPELAQFVANHALLYKGSAAAAVLLQLGCLAAVFLYRRPVLRACLGAGFAIDILGIHVMLQLSRIYSWLPLAVVFVDWDALHAFIRRTPVEPAGGSLHTPPLPPLRVRHVPRLPPPRGRQLALLAGVSVALLPITFLFGMFTPANLHFDLKTYPFARFDMYSVPRMPENEELGFTTMLSDFEVSIDGQRSQEAAARVRGRSHAIGSRTTFQAVLTHMYGGQGMVRSSFPGVPYEIRYYRLNMQEIRPPAPVGLTEVNRSLVGIDRSGTFTAAGAYYETSTSEGRLIIRLEHVGFSSGARFTLAYQRNFTGPPIPFEDVEPLGDGRFVVDFPVGASSRCQLVVLVEDPGFSEALVFSGDYPWL